MAEPARKVYSDEGEDQKLQPHLRVVPGGGESTPREKGHLSSVDTDDTGEMSPEQIQEQEASGGRKGRHLKLAGGTDVDGQDEPRDEVEEAEKDDLDDQTDGSLRRTRARGRILTKKRVAVGGIVGLLAGGSIGFMILFAPILRLENYLSRINERVFGLAAGAVEKRIEHLFGNYILSHVLSLESCTEVRSIDCRADYSNKGIASRLFTQWRDAKVEEKIFDKFGLRIESTTRGSTADGVHRFTLRDRNDRLITISNAEDFERFKRGEFTGGGRELGAQLRGVIRDKTKWYQVMQRRSVRKYLERKHNIRVWCFMFCKGRDEADRRVHDAKVRYKSKFIQRFIYPMSPKYGFIIDCLVSGGATSKCDRDAAKRAGVDRRGMGDDEIDDLIDRINGRRRDSTGTLTRNLTEEIIEDIITRLVQREATRQTARTAVRAIPIAGWIYLGLTVLEMFATLDDFVDDNGFSKLAAELNAHQYLEFYVGMRTAQDETKSHALMLDEVGAISSDFAGTEPNQTAESSRVYQARYGDKDQEKYHQADTEYKCKNGQPIAVDEYVCPEKKIGRDADERFAIEEFRDNPLVDGLINILDKYRDCAHPDPGLVPCAFTPRQVIKPLLSTIDKIADTIIGSILGVGLSILQSIPIIGDGIEAVMDFVTEKAAELMMFFMRIIFPLPIQEDSEPREKYDALEAGGEFTAYEFCKGGYDESGKPYGVGCERLSPTEAVEAEKEYFDQLRYDYDHQSFFARLTDTEYSDSLANHAIMAMPTSMNQLFGKISSSYGNLFGSFGGNLFGFAFTPAFAAEDPIDGSPFGVAKYGYKVGAADLSRNPEEYTDEFCEEAKERWEDSEFEDPRTGFEEYEETNPCLMEETAVEAAGLFFDEN